MEALQPEDDPNVEGNVVTRRIMTTCPAILDSEDESYCSEEETGDDRRLEDDVLMSMKIGMEGGLQETEDEDRHHKRISLHNQSPSSSSSTFVPQVRV